MIDFFKMLFYRNALLKGAKFFDKNPVVQGRFEEVSFSETVEQSVLIVKEAIQGEYSQSQKTKLKKNYNAGWLGDSLLYSFFSFFSFQSLPGPCRALWLGLETLCFIVFCDFS